MEFDNENIIYKNVDGLEFIQFKKLLEMGILNAYTLNCKDIDFTYRRKESLSSYEKLCKALNIKEENLMVPKQSHTDTVKCVNRVLKEEELMDIDGLITDKKDLILATRNADCILFLFYDPVKKVIANVHSGWKGTFKKIALKTVVKMQTNYGCNPQDILCFISPSIRKCHFEVDEDVKDLCMEIFSFRTKNLNEFKGNIEKENPTIADIVVTKGEVKDGLQKYNIDTVLINRILLEDFGLKPENIIDSNLCSMCHKDKINSARAQGKGFKRAIAIIKL